MRGVFVVDRVVEEQPGDLCGFRASGRIPVELVGWICFISTMRTSLESEPTSNWQCFHAFFIHKVYIDEEWVAQELRGCKAGISGKAKENDEDSLDKSAGTWIIEAELVLGASVPDDLTIMEEFADADTPALVVE